MCRVRSCCFCLSLRTGTYFAAIYTIVLMVIQIIGYVLALVNLGKVGEEVDKNVGLKSDKAEEDSTVGKIVYWLGIILLVAWLISAILIIVGVRKDRRGFLIPWLVITIIMIVFAAFGVIAVCFEIKKVFEDGGRALSFCIQIFMFIFNIYLVIVVCSYYRNNLKEADER